MSSTNFDFESTISSLVVGGGGVKGNAALGALHRLMESGYIVQKNLVYFSGTSIGAAICALICVGHTPIDIFVRVLRWEFSVDLSTISIRQILEKFGLLDVRDVLWLAREMLESKTEGPINYRELKHRFNKELYVTSVDLNSNTEVKYSADTTPEYDVFESLCDSCNLPGIFTARISGDMMLSDGGLCNSVPWSNLPTSIPPENVLVIVLTGPANPDPRNSGSGATHKPVVGILDYMIKVALLPVQQLTEFRLECIPTEANVLRIGVNSGTLNFSMSENSKRELFAIGYDAAKTFEKIVKIKV